jgi:polysaccharide export outer membrane protein
LGILKLSGVIILSGFFCSCSSYKQNVMFRVPKGQALSHEIQKAESNYIVQKNDRLKLEVYTNRGEKILDPSLNSLQSNTGAQTNEVNLYLVDQAGNVKFPLLDELKIEGLTLRQAEQSLQQQYSKYYQEPFVILNYANKRVVVLGASGGQVIPLVNENVRLTEVLALAHGVSIDGKAHNIRILRDQEVFVADLSTIDGYVKNNIIIQPNDIVYIEPVRKPVTEAIRDYGPVLSVITSLVTVVVVVLSVNQN